MTFTNRGPITSLLPFQGNSATNNWNTIVSKLLKNIFQIHIFFYTESDNFNYKRINRKSGVFSLTFCLNFCLKRIVRYINALLSSYTCGSLK